ncbi:MAG: hypothetical protein RL077_417 [Verrucomicrobiota bacterium]
MKGIRCRRRGCSRVTHVLIARKLPLHWLVPGYGKRFKPEQEPLQEMIKRRDLAGKQAVDRASLQEMWRAQSPLVVALIAHLAGTTSPADTMSMMRRLIIHGQELLINKPTHSDIPPTGSSAEQTGGSRRGNASIECRPIRSNASARKPRNPSVAESPSRRPLRSAGRAHQPSAF